MRKLTTLLMFTFTFLFSYTIIAQQMRAFRGNYNINFPKKIMKPMGNPLPPGTYTIGNSGDFPTIDSAFNKLSVDGIAGPVTLELIDTLYTSSTDSNGFLLNGPIPGADQNNRVTIEPAENKHVTIQGNPKRLLVFMNTSYLTIDGIGLSGPTTLTIHALKSQSTLTSGVGFTDNSDHNIIKHITVINENYNSLSLGIGFWSINYQGTATTDSNLIYNNFVKKAAWGIFIEGSASQKAKGNIIRENYVGSEADSLIDWGIQLTGCQNTLVENNVVQNLKFTFNIEGDEINVGINSYAGNADTIRNNIVHNIRSSTGYTSTGILLSGTSNEKGNNNIVYNNIVYDIQSTSTASNSRVTGVQMWDQNNPKIYYNSVYLTGKGSSPYGSAALYIDYCTNVEVKNNILVNTRDESPYRASTIYDYTTSNLVSDNNDLYCGGNQNNYLVITNSSEYNTMGSWQKTGKDLLSITKMPNFKAPDDLHINESIPTNLEKRGTPISSINVDFDGNSRDANLPDIGADEFNGKIAQGPLMSGYTVGQKGYFPTIDSAFKRLSTDGISGAVTFELIDTLYTAPSDDYGFLLNGPIQGADENNRITIKPAANKNVTIEGNGRIVVSFLNTNYVTVDGAALTGNATLTIHTLYNSQYNLGYGGSITFIDNSNHNVVHNLTVLTDNTHSWGIGFVMENSQSLYAPDSNLIQNNFVKKAGVGIHFSGLTSQGVTVKRPADNIISRNFVGSETDTSIIWGIEIEYCKNTIIENNLVTNFSNNTPYIQHIALGIDSYNSMKTIIRNNTVHNFPINSNQIAAAGIMLDGDTNSRGTDNLVYNNMIYDITDSSKQYSSRVAGIDLWNQTNPKIYYNSVYLTGKGSSPYGSAALYINSNCINVEAKNNILVNTRDESPYYASSINEYTTSDLVSNNNDLYSGEAQYNCLAKIGSSEYTTLTSWQSKGEGLNSITEMPSFKAPDLHIDESFPTNLESHGTPITGIDVDIDGDARGTDSTDIGADEFKGTTIVGVNDKVTQPLVFNLEQNYPNPFNPSTKIKYSIPKQSYITLKVYDILGREVATLVNEEKPAGIHEVTWDARNLASGVYFYKIKAGDFVQIRKMVLMK